MITVINRPLGHKLTDASVEATAYDSSGEALFITEFAHGLADGDYVYVQSVIGSYNGYKYVDSIAYNEFKLQESETGDYVQFKQSVEISYRVSVLQHGYLAISQPIVYELESNLWPNNLPGEAYTPNVIDSQADAEGYTQLNLSQALADPIELNFIELVGSGDLAGPYQIVTVLQPWAVIINLAYDASNDFSGYTVVKYFNNYCVNVDVYSGLPADHPWYAEKPYALLATLRFTPDENARVKFSISDIVKGYINTRNNLTLDTLPNNLDFMTGFYIDYFESYDDSDGEEISTYEGPMFSDLVIFEGHAINADMPFKSLYISHMSEYLNEDTYYAKWLVLQTRPVVVIGYYFDLSFINSYTNRDLLIHIGEEVVRIADPGPGVIRVPIEPTVAGELCVTAFTDESTQEISPENDNLSVYSQSDDSASFWVISDTLSTTFVNSINGEFVGRALATGNGVTLKVNYNITIFYTKTFPTPAILRVTFYLQSTFGIGGDSQYAEETVTTMGTNVEVNLVGSVDILATSARSYFAMFPLTGPDSATFIINSISFGESSTVVVPGVQITEQICLEVLEECDSTFIPDDDIRLTEDGDFRILE